MALSPPGPTNNRKQSKCFSKLQMLPACITVSLSLSHMHTHTHPYKHTPITIKIKEGYI